MERNNLDRCWKSRCGAVLFLMLSIALLVLWLWTRFTYDIDRQLAVNSTADLSQQYLTHFHDFGDWPSAGEIQGNRGMDYVQTKVLGNGRTDIFRFSRGLQVTVSLHAEGTLLMHLSDEKY